MVLFINDSLSTGTVIEATTNNVTGSLFLTVLLAVFVLAVLAIGVFKIPGEISFALILAPVVVAAAYIGEMYATMGIIIFYLAVILMRIIIAR